MAEKRFDARGFYEALSTTVTARDLTWKQVSQDTGVSASTLSRMAIGRVPDAASVAALSAWAGLNTGDFVAVARRRMEPLAMVGKLFREDPNLDDEGVKTLEAIVRTTYERVRRSKRR
jgi:transcriptional regulator with XRE-family HTH domain